MLAKHFITSIDFVENCTKMIEQNPNDADAYYNRGIVWLHLQNWEEAEADLIAAKDLGFDINASFYNDYGNITDYEQRNGVKVPENRRHRYNARAAVKSKLNSHEEMRAAVKQN